MPVRGPQFSCAGFFIVTDPIDDALTAAASTPQAMSGDGLSVTNRSISDLIALKKFEAANQLADEIASGQSQLLSIIGRPPGAGGSHLEDC